MPHRSRCILVWMGDGRWGASRGESRLCISKVTLILAADITGLLAEGVMNRKSPWSVSAGNMLG